MKERQVMNSSLKVIMAELPWDLLCALGASLLAAVLYFTLGPTVTAKTPLVPFLMAVLLAGSFSTRAGSFAVAIAVIALATSLPPVGVPWVVEQLDQIVVAIFVATASCVVLICGLVHRGRRRIQLQAEALRDAEHAAILLNRRFQIALDAGRMIAWDRNLSGDAVIRSENAKAMFGLRDDAHADFLTLVESEDRPRLESAIRTAIDEGSGYYCEYRARCTDGVTRWFGERAQVVDSIAGHRHLSGASVDITERVHLEEQLRVEQRQKDTFLATLAHELRNPLAPLTNGLELLRRSVTMSDALRATHATMGRQLAHMGRLIDDLLDVSRVTHGKIILDRQAVPLGRIVEMAIETVQPTLDQAMQKIDLEDLTFGQEIDGDPVRLTQIFSSLLNNASRFSPTGGTIKLTAKSLGSALEVSIIDSGTGIPPRYLERVLELFWQVPEAEGGAPRGLGIGLSLSNTLASLHGGSLVLQSKGLGFGTTATVRLPCILMTAATLGTSLPSKTLEAPNTRRILVVDDNVDAANSLAILLQVDGHHVEVAHSGAKALELHAQNPADVAILDVGMPEMDGMELCRRLRKTAVGPNMLIVTLTGWGDSGTRDESHAAGFNAHFVKPLSELDRSRLLGPRTPLAGCVIDKPDWAPEPLQTMAANLQSGIVRTDEDDRELQ